MARRIPLLIATLLLALVAAAPAVASYPWPVRPFGKQHPIRANFGDPRTVFLDPLYADGIDGPGSFSFHNGVDIAARDGTPVYAVVSGTVKVIDATAVAVQTLDDRTFQYFHVVPTVIDGTKVQARIDRIGYVQAPYAHVHLSEIDAGRVTNPLRRGHLTPYVDKTRPRVDAIEIRDAGGKLSEPLGVCGRVSIAAEAFDRPPLHVGGSFGGLPVAPALVAWQLQRVGGRVVIHKRNAVDFRTTLPAPRDFWDVYARGSYQNAPRFGPQQFGSMPGRFLFELTRALDTRTLSNGPYVLTVSATDERRNVGVLAQRFWIFNARTPTGCRTAPAPTAAPPAPPAPAPQPSPPAPDGSNGAPTPSS
jgi:hypothetical protein